ALVRQVDLARYPIALLLKIKELPHTSGSRARRRAHVRRPAKFVCLSSAASCVLACRPYGLIAMCGGDRPVVAFAATPSQTKAHFPAASGRLDASDQQRNSYSPGGPSSLAVKTRSAGNLCHRKIIWSISSFTRPAKQPRSQVASQCFQWKH